MKISKLNNALLYSNKNVEKLLKTLINESSNAVLMETFSDGCIIGDHTNGKIYKADYSFDGKTVVFENFDQIEIEENNDELKEEIGKYFSDESTTDDINEAYESDSEESKNIFTESISEAVSGKNMSKVIDYSELKGINEEIKIDEPFFEEYKERLNTHPTTSIKYFNFKDPVKVTLIDEDENSFVNKNIFNKAKKLKTNKDFKKEISEAAEAYINGDNTVFEDLASDETSVLALDKSEMTELVGLSVVGNANLMENRKNIVEGFNKIIDENELLKEQKCKIDETKEKCSKETEKDEEELIDVNEEDIDKLSKALDKALEKITDQKLVDKIGELKNALELSKANETTDVKAIKECVELLSM